MRDRFRLLVRLLVVAAVVSSTAAPFVFMATATPGPSGMVGIPNANVHASVPQHAADKIPQASAFYGNVMTSRSASSLELTVTTAGAANGRAQRGSSELALQFSDELDHQGRRVAVGVDVLQEALGYVPKVANVEHSSGATYTVPIVVEGGVAVWELRAFSTNTVTFDGEVNVTGTYSDGSTVSYDLSDLDAASSPNATLTGTTASEWNNVSANGVGDGGTVALDVAGTMAPSGPSSNGEPTVTFTGRLDTEVVFVDGSANLKYVDDAGNVVDLGVQAVGAGKPADLDADGDTDVPYIESGTDTLMWVDTAGNTVSTGITATTVGGTGDFTGDGTPEVAFSSTGNELGYVNASDTSGIILVGTNTYAAGGFVDWGSDGDLDMLYMDGSSNMNVRDAAGNAATIQSSGTASPGGGGDIDGDGDLDVAYESVGGELRYIDESGNVVTMGQATDVGGVTDFDSDDDLDIAYIDGGTLRYVDASSNTVDTGLGANAVGHYGQMGEGTTDPGIDIDGDGTDEASHSGTLAGGETVTYEIAGLSTADDTATVSTTSGNVDVLVEFKERTGTPGGSLDVNGNSSSFAALADGETASLSWSSPALQEGANTVNVSLDTSGLSADAPPPQLELVYGHDAASKIDTAYEAEAWSERYNVSKRWESSRENAQLTINFVGSVVATREAKYRVNEGAWQTPSTSWDGTTLTVGLGSVSAGDTTTVVVNGSKVRVNNGSIQVLEPTQNGDSLDTRFTLESWNNDSYIAVGGTAEGVFLHYLANESYSSPDEYALVDNQENQELYLPNAQAGASATVRTIPLDADPQTDVALEVDDPSEPRFSVRPGDVSGDSVTFVWHDTVSGNTYGLYSATRDGYKITSDEAASPVELVGDDDEAVLYIALVDENGGGGTAGAGGGGGNAPLSSSSSPLGSPYLIIIVAVVAIVGVGWAARQSRVPTWAAVGGVALAGVLALEALSPGAISGVVLEVGSSLSSGVAQVSPALVLSAGGIALWAVYRVVKKFTRKENVVLSLRGRK